MKMKEKRNLKLILFGVIILIAIIATAIIIYNSKVKINNETILAKETTRNIGIPSESTANSWDTSKLSEIIVDTSMVDSETGEAITMYVPIPNGYTASKATSEDTVIDGLVIYEGTDEVNDSNVIDAKTTRNQYVWIPVDPEDVYWTDEDGSIYGIEYTFTEEGSTPNYDKTEPAIKYNNSYQNSYFDYYLDEFGSKENSGLELLSDMQNDFSGIMESIEKYGGFYIGRYEIGKSSSLPVEMQAKSVYNSINWFDAYELCKELSGSNEFTTTCLIYGCLYDATLEFLVKTGNKKYSEIVDASGWGNYTGTTFTYTNTSGNQVTKSESSQLLIPTGSTEYTNACNIYDLAGNIREYTQEISVLIRSTRGGGHQDYGSYSPGIRSQFYVDNRSYRYGCRAVLWIS